jgi:hypothetical protein
MSNMAVVVNDNLTLEYDRTKDLPEHQAAYLEKLDNRFEQGIELQGEKIDQPDIGQRAKYMALSLMEGIIYQEDDKAAVSMAWLATRLPDLKQVKVLIDEQGSHFDLIFDREYQPQIAIDVSSLTLPK